MFQKLITPGHDQITSKILSKIPRKVIVIITDIYNAIIRLHYFSLSLPLKISYIVMVPKFDTRIPLKYHRTDQISPLPVLSNALVKIISPYDQTTNSGKQFKILSHHRLCFIPEHATLEQARPVTKLIENSLKEKDICGSFPRY